MIDLVPMIDICNDHSAAGDWNSLIGISVDHIHLKIVEILNQMAPRNIFLTQNLFVAIG